MAVEIDEPPILCQRRGDLDAFEAVWQEFVRTDRSNEWKKQAAIQTRIGNLAPIVERLEAGLNDDELAVVQTEILAIVKRYNKK